jgi:DNA-binding LytR/AlgR family response regulator
MKKILIVEDDVLISEHLAQIISESPFELTEICSREESALESIKNDRPDCALLDIRLHGNDSGIKIGEKLNELSIPFMYLTSFSDKNTIQEAVYTEPIGYLLKPFETEEIEKALQKFLNIQEDSITVKVGYDKVKIKLSDILYVKSDNVYLEIFCRKNRYLIREKMSELIKLCGANQLVKVQRSYAVNPKNVNRISAGFIYFEEDKVPYSKSYQSQVDKLL